MPFGILIIMLTKISQTAMAIFLLDHTTFQRVNPFNNLNFNNNCNQPIAGDLPIWVQ
jgi:hypothetical protein